MISLMSVFGPFGIIANTFLIVAGLCLFPMQMHTHLDTAYPNDFGFNSVERILEHEDEDTLAVRTEPKSNQSLDEPNRAPILNEN